MWGTKQSVANVIDWQQVPAEQKFTLAHLKMLYIKLVDNKVVTTANQSMVIEILRVLSEMVVFGDNKSEQIFE